MKKKVLTLLLTLAALLPAAGQNNPYAIDDECYKYFTQAEILVGKPGFKEVNEELLRTALLKEDTKAQTLYYVNRLKNETRILSTRFRETDDRSISPEEEQRLLTYLEDTKAVSRKFNYEQYFYYAYSLVQNVYFNAEQFLKGTELVMEMLSVAEENKEDYGIWMANCYMVSMYVSQNDYVSAKNYILNGLSIYQTSHDPYLLRQSTTRLYCDLTDTYPIGNDSVRINLEKAEMNRKQHLDTLRCKYYRAKLSAYNMDTRAYEEYRDYCLEDPRLAEISRTAPLLFSNIDKIVYGSLHNFAEDDLESMEGNSLRELKYIANTAERYGFKDQAFELEKRLVQRHERSLAASNQSKISELDARLGNMTLSAKVNEQSHQIERTTRRFTIIILMALGIFLVLSWVYIFSLRRANRKVKLADAAKTRFVQNMSHEVRTPLNAIVGFSQLLALPDGSFPEEEKDEFSNHIINNTKMLNMLLDDILNASAMDSGNYSIAYELSEKDFIAQAAISSAEHRLQPGVRLYYEPEEAHPFEFTTDPRRTQQVLINLITNACKHTSKGEIKVGSSLKARPGYVTYSVTDTGPGIPADKAEKIFERFSKLNDFVQGTGLGLSICRDIATRMGAEVYLDTTYTAGGARFVFQVPVNPVTGTEADKK